MRNVAMTIGTVTRIVQVVFSVIILACSAFILSKGRWWGRDAFGFALFTSVTGIGLSVLMLVGPKCNAVLAERLPGLLDIILSGIWALFFLSAGGNLGAYGSCDSWWGYAYYGSYGHYDNDGNWVRETSSVKTYCAVWNVVTAFCLLNFALFAVSTVLAGLDLHHGKGLVKPRRFRQQPQPADGPVIMIVPQNKAVHDVTYPAQMSPQMMEQPQTASQTVVQMPSPTQVPQSYPPQMTQAAPTNFQEA